MSPLALGLRVNVYYGNRMIPGEHVITKLTSTYAILDGKSKIRFDPNMLFSIKPVVQEPTQQESDDLQALLDQIPETLARKAREDEEFQQRVAEQKHQEAVPGEMTSEEFINNYGLGAVNWSETRRRNKMHG